MEALTDWKDAAFTLLPNETSIKFLLPWFPSLPPWLWSSLNRSFSKKIPFYFKPRKEKIPWKSWTQLICISPLFAIHLMSPWESRSKNIIKFPPEHKMSVVVMNGLALPVFGMPSVPPTFITTQFITVCMLLTINISHFKTLRHICVCV